MQTYSRRALLGSGAAAAGAVLLDRVARAQGPANAVRDRAPEGQRDAIAEAISDGLRRNHADAVRNGIRGEHLRTYSTHLTLLIAHGRERNVDRLAQEALGRQIDAVGREGFMATDFAAHSKAMIEQRLGESYPLPWDSRPTRPQLEKFTNQVLVGGYSAFLTRCAKATVVQSHTLDAERSGQPRLRRIGCEGDLVDADPFNDGCSADGNSGSGGTTCSQIKALKSAAEAATALACAPPFGELFPAVCLSCAIMLADAIMLTWVYHCE
jgi:hypothetical protein